MSHGMSLHHRYRPRASHCQTHSDMLDSDRCPFHCHFCHSELHCVSIWLWLLLCHSCMSGEQKEARCRVGWWDGSCRLGWTFPSPCFNKLCTVLQDYPTYPTTPLSLYRNSFMRGSLTTNFTLVIVFFACSDKT